MNRTNLNFNLIKYYIVREYGEEDYCHNGWDAIRDLWQQTTESTNFVPFINRQKATITSRSRSPAGKIKLKLKSWKPTPYHAEMGENLQANILQRLSEEGDDSLSLLESEAAEAAVVAAKAMAAAEEASCSSSYPQLLAAAEAAEVAARAAAEEAHDAAKSKPLPQKKAKKALFSERHCMI